MTQHSSKTWPIAAAMLPFGNGQKESPQKWLHQLAEVAFEGFESVDLTDSWIQPGDLTAQQLQDLTDATSAAGVKAIALSAIRRSVIDPIDGVENLAYSHRTLDAAAVLGIPMVSFGLHRPLLANQQGKQWFWTEQGPVDATDDQNWTLAADRIRELGNHANELGIELSLDMYEDTLIGTTQGTLRLIDEIGLDNVGINPDLGNLYRMHRDIEDFQESIEALAPRTNYWHVKSYYRDVDANKNLITTVPAPMETGSMNYRAAIKTVVQAGFNGAFCVEHYGGDGLSVSALNAIFGDSGAAKYLKRGSVVIITSTVGEAPVVAAEEKLAHYGVGCLDAALSGGPVRALDGELLLMVGGDVDAYPTGHEVLKALSSTLSIVGEKVGQGQQLKVVNQLLCGIHTAAANEALALAHRYGLDLDMVVEVLGTGAAASFMFADRGPRIAQQLRGQTPPLRSRLDVIGKDMGIVGDQTRVHKLTAPVASATEQLHRMSEAAGVSAEDDLIVATLLGQFDEPAGA